MSYNGKTQPSGAAPDSSAGSATLSSVADTIGDEEEKTIEPAWQRKTLIDYLRTQPSIYTDEPPDGGFQAWLQVILGHLTVFNSFGYINSFGIFQQYYIQSLSDSNPSSISWIGGLQVFLVYFIGIFSGRAVDAGFFHLTITLGFACQIIGAFTTSTCESTYWALLLSQGFCTGLGHGLAFCPVVTLVNAYFSRRRALAIACVASGGATGGLVFPSIAQSLLFKIGFAWTVRVMGFVMLFNAILVISFTRIRAETPKRNEKGSLTSEIKHDPVIDLRPLLEPAFLLYTLGVCFALMAIFPAYYYVRPFARDVLHTPEHTSFSVLLVLNGVGLPGRIIPALLAAHYFGALNMLIIMATIGSVFLFSWTGVHNLPGLWAFVTLFGLPGGGVLSLFPAAMSRVSADMHAPGARFGLVFAVASPAVLCGPPIVGALIRAMDGSYLGAQLFLASSMALAVVLFIVARWLTVGWQWRVRL